jgi:hypothetical protein
MLPRVICAIPAAGNNKIAARQSNAAPAAIVFERTIPSSSTDWDELCQVAGLRPAGVKCTFHAVRRLRTVMN